MLTSSLKLIQSQHTSKPASFNGGLSDGIKNLVSEAAKKDPEVLKRGLSQLDKAAKTIEEKGRPYIPSAENAVRETFGDILDIAKSPANDMEIKANLYDFQKDMFSKPRKAIIQQLSELSNLFKKTLENIQK